MTITLALLIAGATLLGVAIEQLLHHIETSDQRKLRVITDNAPVKLTDLAGKIVTDQNGELQWIKG